MKTYYLEITKKRGQPQIDKITTNEEHRARRKAISLMKSNRNIKEIKISEVISNKYCTTITR